MVEVHSHSTKFQGNAAARIYESSSACAVKSSGKESSCIGYAAVLLFLITFFHSDALNILEMFSLLYGFPGRDINTSL